MKKQNLKTQGLSLNKKVVAQFEREAISGGTGQNLFTVIDLSCGGAPSCRDLTRFCEW